MPLPCEGMLFGQVGPIERSGMPHKASGLISTEVLLGNYGTFRKHGLVERV